MEKANAIKTFAVSACAVLLVIACVFGLAACGEPASLYKVDFAGTSGDQYKYQIDGTTWKESNEEGFEKVYTLTGEVAYNMEVAQALGYVDAEGNGRTHFALIHFTSDDLARVSYDETKGTGFYAKITNFYGTDKAEEVIKHGGFGAYAEDADVDTSHEYFLFQGVDDTVRTLTLEISFDGTAENAKTYKFVIDPKNYTLEEAPAVTEAE